MNEDRIADAILIGSYLIIIILRICNVINWGWQWILIPFWLPIVLCIPALAIAIILVIIIIINRMIMRYKK